MEDFWTFSRNTIMNCIGFYVWNSISSRFMRDFLVKDRFIGSYRLSLIAFVISVVIFTVLIILVVVIFIVFFGRRFR